MISYRSGAANALQGGHQYAFDFTYLEQGSTQCAALQLINGAKDERMMCFYTMIGAED